jgi:hypothetical protein
VNVEITSPKDFSILGPSFDLKFKIEGGFTLGNRSKAVVLINNRELAMVPVNRSLGVQTSEMRMQQVQQMTYDITVVLLGAPMPAPLLATPLQSSGASPLPDLPA